MSEIEDMKKAVESYQKAAKEKTAAIRKAVDEVRTVRQVRTEQPNR